MFEGSGSLRLLNETSLTLLVSDELRREYFYGDFAVQFDVERTVHDPMSPRMISSRTL